MALSLILIEWFSNMFWMLIFFRGYGRARNIRIGSSDGKMSRSKEWLQQNGRRRVESVQGHMMRLSLHVRWLTSWWRLSLKRWVCSLFFVWATYVSIHPWCWRGQPSTAAARHWLHPITCQLFRIFTSAILQTIRLRHLLLGVPPDKIKGTSETLQSVVFSKIYLWKSGFDYPNIFKCDGDFFL